MELIRITAVKVLAADIRGGRVLPAAATGATAQNPIDKSAVCRYIVINWSERR
jgi:hypothetical protein